MVNELAPLSDNALRLESAKEPVEIIRAPLTQNPLNRALGK